VKEQGCSGIALDPTVNQPAEMVPGVFFLKLGATMHDTPVSWQSIELPRLWRWLGRRSIFALKYGARPTHCQKPRRHRAAACVARCAACAAAPSAQRALTNSFLPHATFHQL
jgi:hypothetical protein